MTTEPYPVVVEESLSRPRTRLLAFSRRPLTDIPRQTPGTVLVFETGGRFEVFHERRHLTGREPAVVDAVAVSLVDVRSRFVPVDLSIASASPADNFPVRVSFECKVTNVPLVAQNGLRDVVVPLREHLKQDDRLHSVGADCRIDDINAAREVVLARITAYCTLNPPTVPGVRTELRNVEIFAPTSLREHARRLRDEAWWQTTREQRRVFELDDAARLADLAHSGPELVEGLALSRGDITAGQAADRGYAIQEEKERHLVELLALLQKDGHLDRSHVDADLLVDAFTDSIAPHRSRESGRLASARPAMEGRASLAASANQEDLVLDEDELDDDALDR